MKSLITLFATGLLLAAGPALAATDNELTDIKSQLAALLDRVNALEAENATLRSTTSKSDKGSWADKISMKGDFRYRYENIDPENSDTRERNRVRARLGVTADLPNDVQVGIGLASGGIDPLSTNQSLGSLGSTKDIRLDLAYFKWKANSRVSVVGGKFKNVFFKPEKHGMIWDGDYNPEGLALTFDNGSFFANGALHFLESDSKKGSPRFVIGGQGGVASSVGDGLLTLGGGYYSINVAGKPTFLGAFLGNSSTCVDPATLTDCTYDHNYEEIELFAHFKTELSGRPLVLFADYVNNQDASDYDTGWSAGAKLGKASAPGTWEIGYTYQDLEADATFAALTDSDFGGGGTDGEGHIVKGAIAVNKSWKIGLTYFSNSRNENLGTEQDYKRLQIDSAFKF
jgi:hypothetical protein